MTKKIVVNLHTHERSSQDSNYSMNDLYNYYNRYFHLPVFIGFVAHDDEGVGKIPRGEKPELSILGTEYTVNRDNDLHIIDYPEYDFSFLAHPKHTFSSDNKKEKAEEVIRRYQLDGVEKYRMGRRQYRGALSGSPLANDDAHSPHVIGSSYMVVEVDRIAPGNILEEIKKNRHQLYNDPPSSSQRVGHKMYKAKNMIL